MHYRYLTIEQRQMLVSLTRSRLSSRALDAALERLRQGNYGVCGDCGEDIAFVQLQDDPLAMRCRACAAWRPPLVKRGAG